MNPMTPYDRPTVGDLLRWWRNRRGLSQMALAQRAGVSPRHMSFVETGRSRPGREVLVRIADALDLPFRDTNALLEAAGHARRYSNSTFDDQVMDRLQEILQVVLTRYEPYSAVVMDAAWRLLMANEAHHRLSAWILGGAGASASRPGEINLLDQLFRPGGFRERLANWPSVAHHLLVRLRRQVADNPARSDVRDLLERLESYDLPPAPQKRQPDLPVLPMHFVLGDVELRLVSLITTFGAPQDVTAQELRLEAFLPGDEATDRALRGLVHASDGRRG